VLEDFDGLSADRLPGSEWRLHRQWFHDSAWPICWRKDFSLAEKDTLYPLPGQAVGASASSLPAFAPEMGGPLWGQVLTLLLYDLTSTYFESDPPFPEGTNGSSATAGTNGPIVCSGHRAWWSAGGFSTGLRSDAGHTKRQDHAARLFSRRSRNLWQGSAGLGG